MNEGLTEMVLGDKESADRLSRLIDREGPPESAPIPRIVRAMSAASLSLRL